MVGHRLSIDFFKKNTILLPLVINGVYMPNVITNDLTGKTINNLFVIKENGRGYFRQVLYLCRCICGNEVNISYGALTKANPQKSCGCMQSLVKNDLTGKIHNNVFIIRRIHEDRRIIYYLCKCHCGNEFEASKNELTRSVNPKNSCGCLNRRYSVDITNQKFGRLTAIKKVGVKCTESLWECLCDCGNTTNVKLGDLKSNGTKSCGCYRKDQYLSSGIRLSKQNKRGKLLPLLNGVEFKSGYEYVFAEYLNSKNIKWSYEPKIFLLSNGKSYIPDFYLEETNEWIEVKGYMHDISRVKIELLEKDYGIKIIIIDEDYIFKIKADYNKWIKSIPRKEDFEETFSFSDLSDQIQVTYSYDES